MGVPQNDPRMYVSTNLRTGFNKPSQSCEINISRFMNLRSPIESLLHAEPIFEITSHLRTVRRLEAGRFD